MSQSEKIVDTTTSVGACAARIGLTIVNILLALIDLRGWNTVVGLLIAAVQAAISAMFLMHMRWSRGIVRLVGVIGLLSRRESRRGK